VRADAQSNRPWQVSTSIEVRYLVRNFDRPRTFHRSYSQYDPIVWSSDRRFFFFETSRGNLACDCNEFRLDVFSSAQVETALSASQAGETLSPTHSITMRSNASADDVAGIRNPRWIDDNRVLFYGTGDNGPEQLYLLDTSSGAVSPITASPDRIFAFDYAAGNIAYQTVRQGSPPRRYPAFVLGDAALPPDMLFTGVSVERQLYVRRGLAPAQLIGSSRGPMWGPWISPNGRWAVAALSDEEATLPSSWQDYQLHSDNARGFGAAAQFVLIDLNTGAKRSLVDAPVGLAVRSGWNIAPRAIWIDANNVILVNTALPPSRPEHRTTSYVVAVDVRSGASQQITALSPPAPLRGDQGFLAAAAWDASQEQLSLTYTTPSPTDVNVFSGPTRTLAFRRNGDRWGPSSPDARVTPPDPAGGVTRSFEVRTHEDANTSPTIVASGGGKTLALLQADAALQSVAWSRVETITVPARTSGVMTIGYIAPLHLTQTPPPLVIQILDYDPNFFYPDGTSYSTYAAQALAASGFAVVLLTMPSTDAPETTSTPREGSLLVERVDDVVSYLAARSFINANKVGLVGFSRAGFISHYATTHPGRTRISAAVIGDSYTGSYDTYVFDRATSPASYTQPFIENQMGGVGGTFWENKDAWLREAPLFNVDRSRTPTLFTMHGSDQPLQTIEQIAAYRANHVPNDFIFFPDGYHQLQRPLERLASLTATVDWMKFWLSDVNPTSNADESQRWQRMRQEWRARNVSDTSRAQ
jgi:dienelactone hydrolase